MSGEDFIAMVFIAVFVLALVGTPFVASLRLASKRDRDRQHPAH